MLKSLVFAALLLVTFAQIPIPQRPDGFAMGSFDAPVVLDVHLDLLCPDSKATWPNLLAIKGKYTSKVTVVHHTFPLPYHRNAFLAGQGAHVLAGQKSYVDLMFANQDSFSTSATMNMSATDVIAAMDKLVSGAGVAAPGVIAAGLQDATMDENTRISWKYGCSRGVAGTPWFFINGVPLSADPTWDINAWSQVIDPLLNPSNAAMCRLAKQKRAAKKVPVVQFANGVATCPAGDVLCTYMPGKTQCCLAGEMCIPNVGCRC